MGHGDFCWYDLMTTDTGAAAKYYGAVFGWATEAMDAGDPPYTMWKADGAPFGGLLTLPKHVPAGTPPHWMAYVTVDDVDTTTARAVELGATVIVPGTDIPGMGRFSVLADPQGAVIALWMTVASPECADEAPLPVPRISWHELATSDWKKAAEFYDELFGWKTINEHDMGPVGVYRIFGREAPTGGMFNRPQEMPVNAWLYYVEVTDAEAAVGQVTENGGQVLNGPMEVPGGDRVAQCMDAQGAAFAIHERKKA